MLRGLPFTLWRSILGELTKLLALSAGVMVTVIAFAACVKPLSDGMLQAGDLLKFVLLAIPPMLAYALPFAAGFASTLTYHRMAHENETVAVHAGGISHRAMLMPAVLLAIALSASLVVLNEAVIPRFLKEMQRIITVDVARLIAQEIQKGKAVELGDMMIYADQAKSIEPPKGSGATDQLLLKNFAAIRLAPDRRPVSELTASLATIWLMPDTAREEEGEGPAPGESDGRSRVIVKLQNVVAVEGAGLVSSGEYVKGWTVPNAFRDKTKFLTWRQLRALKDRPEMMSWIDALRRDLAGSLALTHAIEAVRASLAGDQRLAMLDGEGDSVMIFASSAEPAGESRWNLRPAAPGGTIDVHIFDQAAPGAGGGPTMMIAAESAVLVCNPMTEQISTRLEFRLELDKVRVSDAAGTVTDSAERAHVALAPLSLADSPAKELLAQTSPQLVKTAEDHLVANRADATVAARVEDMRGQLSRLARQVLAKQNERLALALSSAVMILTGALTALKLSRQLPLTVYLWMFLPAVASMVTISGGSQMVVKMGPSGLILMWSGVGALAVYTLLVFRSLARH